jgi:hypothetical protein
MTNPKFQTIVQPLTTLLAKHHELYSGQCKGEQWEELCAKALNATEFKSDWKPDWNHKPGVDQNTSCGIRISNKGGSLTQNLSRLEISGSRLTKHKTLDEKKNFLSNKTEDYIFCLATNKADWKAGDKRYYFVVVDSKNLNYADSSWKEVTGSKPHNSDKVVSYQCEGNGFTATIQRSMSDQLWTSIDNSLFEEIHEIAIDDVEQDNTK